MLPFLLGFYFLACVVLGMGESCPGYMGATASIAHASIILMLLSPALNSLLTCLFVTPYRRALGKILTCFHRGDSLVVMSRKLTLPSAVGGSSGNMSHESKAYGRQRVLVVSREQNRRRGPLPRHTISADNIS